MTRFAIDAATAVRILDDTRTIAPAHTLVGPARLRSDVLDILYGDVRAGRRDLDAGRRTLEGLAVLKMRLLADRVSRATAWRIALRRGADDTAAAEYLAVASLQADALVTDDPSLRAGAADLVPLAEYDDLF